MEDFIYYNELFDLYESMLTENEKESFKDYYQEDLSLSEIADEKSISRSAVSKTINNVLEKLNTFETKLNLHKKSKEIKMLLQSNDIKYIKEELERILSE